MKNTPKVAIVCDWLYGGGAEKVVLELHKMFPDAPIYTSYCSQDWRDKLDRKVITGYLQYWPFSSLRKFLPVLRIWWFTRLKFDGFGLVISCTGNGESKGIKVPAGTKHICYCFTPTHFYWRHYNQYMKNPGFGIFNWLARLGLKILAGPLRKWDLKASKRPDYLIAISNHIKSDIKKYYGRDSVIIHPPVDTENFALSSGNRHGFVTVGRQTAYKRLDIIIEACNQLELPLKVIGKGPEHKILVRRAGKTIDFPIVPDNKELSKIIGASEAFLFAAYEDFGIAPVEAMATGTPVIAYKAGGALDYVIPGKTGEFFTEQTVESLTHFLKNFEPSAFNQKYIADFAEKFNEQVFKSKFKDLISRYVIKNTQ